MVNHWSRRATEQTNCWLRWTTERTNCWPTAWPDCARMPVDGWPTVACPWAPNSLSGRWSAAEEHSLTAANFRGFAQSSDASDQTLPTHFQLYTVQGAVFFPVLFLFWFYVSFEFPFLFLFFLLLCKFLFFLYFWFNFFSSLFSFLCSQFPKPKLYFFCYLQIGFSYFKKLLEIQKN